jgi:O-antigen ligase
VDRYPSSLDLTQYWSWKAYALIVGLAVSTAVLMVQSPLVWIGIAAMLAVGAQFLNPISSLGVVIFTCGLLGYSPFEAGALSRLYPGDIAIAIFLVAWLIERRSWSRKELFKPDLINRPLLALAIVTPVSMLWSRLHPDPSVTYSFPHSDVSWTMAQCSQLALLAATVCMPFAVVTAIKSWNDIETVIIIMGIVVTLGTLVTIAALIFGFGGTYSILGATRAFWEQPWDTSMEPLSSLLLPFLYAGVLFGKSNLSRYRLVCVLFLFCLVGVVLTFSRESWLLALLGVLVVTVLWVRQRRVSVFSIVTIAGFVFVLLVSGAAGLIYRFYDPNEVYGLERIYFYVTALQLFVTHPWFGVGAGNYQFFDRTYAEVSSGGIAHNQFLTLAAETGVVGFLLFLWLLIAVLRILKSFNLGPASAKDSQYWLKAAGCGFVFAWIAECLFREAFFVTAAAGGGTKFLTANVFAWIFLGILMATVNFSKSSPSGAETSLC